MTYEQFATALTIVPEEGSPGAIYDLRPITQARLVRLLGPPDDTQISEGGCVTLVYEFDGGLGRALIHGYDEDGMIMRGLIYLDR